MARHKLTEQYGKVKYWKSRHDISLDRLLEAPRLIGIKEPIVWATKEMHIYRPDGLGLITDIDLFYKTANGLYLAEYKSSDSQRRRAIHQLHAAHKFVLEHFKQAPELLYVHGEKFTTERVPPEHKYGI